MRHGQLVLLLGLLFLFGRTAHGHPEDPELKFWVQGPNPVTLHSFVRDDARIQPIIIVRSPSLENGTCAPPSGYFCPDLIADAAVCHINQVYGGMTAPTGGFPIAIMIQGFGDGGKSQVGQAAFHFPAPALVRPLALNLTDCPPGNHFPTTDVIDAATGRLNNDEYREFSPNPQCTYVDDGGITRPCPKWYSPWPDLGAIDCADWLRAFAAQYTFDILASHPSNAIDFQPKRLIMDSEAEVGFPFDPQISQMIANCSSDPRADSPASPVRGWRKNGVFDPHEGPSFNDLIDPLRTGTYYNPPCDNCPNGDTQSVHRLQQANINRQAQNAAFARAIANPGTNTQGTPQPSPLDFFPDVDHPENRPK